MVRTAPMAEDLPAEHARLLAQSRELEREHRRLEASPGDQKGHATHRQKLRAQIAELHAHMRRLRGETPDEDR